MDLETGRPLLEEEMSNRVARSIGQVNLSYRTFGIKHIHPDGVTHCSSHSPPPQDVTEQLLHSTIVFTMLYTYNLNLPCSYCACFFSLFA